jgi:hypothetical protein
MNALGNAFEWAAAGVFVLCAGLVILGAAVVATAILLGLLVVVGVAAFFAGVVGGIREVADWFARFCAGSGR